jgi:hypothetical protein
MESRTLPRRGGTSRAEEALAAELGGSRRTRARPVETARESSPSRHGCCRPALAVWLSRHARGAAAPRSFGAGVAMAFRRPWLHVCRLATEFSVWTAGATTATDFRAATLPRPRPGCCSERSPAQPRVCSLRCE